MLYLSISTSSGDACKGFLVDPCATISTHPAIGGRSLGGDKYTASCCRDCDEDPNEEEYPRKRIRAETITKSSAPSGTVSMFKMLPQIDNQLSKVDVKHVNCFGVKSVTSM